MNNIIKYIQDVLGVNLYILPKTHFMTGFFPLYIRENYNFYQAELFNQAFTIVELKDDSEFTNIQIEKHLDLIRRELKMKVVLVVQNMTAINRKRFIEKGINFIVPGKQLFLPEMMIDLRENFSLHKVRKNKDKLLPSAQFILLYYILHRRDNLLLELSFRELAYKLRYTPMAITNAVENLKHYELCEVRGTKERYIRVSFDRHELWNKAEEYFINPVLKKVYVDNRPNMFLLQSNLSALPEYSDMNSSDQYFYAIEKTAYYSLQKSNALINENPYEGKFCLEVWKYDPMLLVEDMYNDRPVVDPLSLYLSLKDMIDERVEMALDQIIEKYTW